MPSGTHTLGLFPDLGQGLGLRPQHYAHVLEHLPPVAWFEIISENFMGLTSSHVNGHRLAEGGLPLENLEKIRANYPIVCHGVSLSIGSVDPLDISYLKNLKKLIDRVQPAMVSDHLCWTGVGGENLHDLLPLPFTREALDHVVSRIRQVQDFLGRRILIENVSSYLTFSQSEIPEWEFLNLIACEADCGILLDLNNIYVSSINHRFDAQSYLHGIDHERVGQFHVAGHSNMGNYLVDTHDQPVCDDVWKLYEDACHIFGSVSTLIERDDNIPEFDELLAESLYAKKLQEKVLGESRAPSKLVAVDHYPSARS